MRSEALSTVNAGMTRLRRKGNASPSTLYDCLNGYITLASTIKARPGTVIDTVLPAGTKGLVAHKGKLHVFSATPVVMTDDDYVSVTLRHPTSTTAAINNIHFAASFMGFLYVVAGFDDGSQWHYWAEELDAWQPATDYKVGDRVFPSVPNGYAYKATRADAPAIKWSPSVARTVGDVVEPTVQNGFDYTVIETTGTTPVSGLSEPIWPEVSGETVVEVAEITDSPEPPTSGEDPPDLGTIDDRYDNPSYGPPRTQR